MTADPRVLVVTGAAAIALTGVFVKLSAVSPATATFYRCALALPILGVMAAREWRRHGGIPARAMWIQIVGGVLLGIDFALWSQSITLIGAGISTVVVNIQVVIVPALAWVVFRARVPVRFVIAVPFLFAGIALVSGIFGGGEGGGDAVAGTVLALTSGVAYAVYIFLTGRAGGAGRPATQVLVTTVSAGISGSVVGSIWGGVDLTPGWDAMGWLVALALSGQVIGWMLIGFGLPKLPAEVGATLLLIQPVLAVMAGMMFLQERPTLIQGLGCAVVVTAVWMVSVPPRARVVTTVPVASG
nr:DMT family transporter [Rhodococcus jostii]